jgi:antirestriction protein ArdC
MQATSSLQHQSVYQIVTEQIIKQLESGVAPWRKPWRTEPPCNLVSGKPYRGVNPFLLAPQGYDSRYWLTFNQANRLGGHVRKGEKSSIVTFWKIGTEKTVVDADGNERKSRSFLLRFYRVFNVEQTEGIADKLGIGKASPRIPNLDQCDAIVARMPNLPRIEQDGKAWYRPSRDVVGMPSRNAFESAEAYYATLFHELTHSTGHSSRVGREGIETLNSFGSELYSKEELVAEMGSAMLCGVTGIEPATIANSASYLQSWIDALRGDSKLIISAASAAQKAADYILNTAKPEENSDESEVA